MVEAISLTEDIKGPHELQTTPMDVRRLVVLVPERGAYGIELARRIWELAEPCALRVLFICAQGSETQETALHLRLATLAAQIRSDQVQVDTHIETGVNWIQAVWRHWQPGDIVICCAEQMIRTLAHGMQPLWQMVEANLGVPVYVLAGLYAEERVAAPTALPPMMRQLARWLIPIAIVAVLIFLQAHVDMAAIGMNHALILLGFGLADLGILAAWAIFT